MRQNISLTFIIMCRLKNVSSAQINRLLSCSSHVGTCVPVMVRSAFCFYTLWFIHVCVIMFLFFVFFLFYFVAHSNNHWWLFFSQRLFFVVVLKW